MNEADAYILIGGRSSRLGRDKAQVEIGGRTLMQRSVEAIRGGVTSRITAVAGNEAQFAIHAINASVPFIFDLHEGRGPLGGLHAALADARTQWIFILACDYPFISSDLIALLIEKVSDQFGCVAPEQNDGRLQPLCAFYKVDAARAVIDEIIDRPRVPPPMHEIVSLLTPRIVTFDEYSHLTGSARFFTNINTAGDLETARLEA